MNQSKERREYLRAQLNVFINEDIKGGCQLTRAMDISEGGVRYIKPAGSFRRNDSDVYLEFCLPDEDLPVQALGKVVADQLDEHTHSTSVVFTAMSTDNAERVRDYVIRRKRAELFESLRQEHMEGIPAGA